MKKEKSFIGKFFSAIGGILLALLVLVIAAAVFLACSTAFMKTASDDIDTYVAAEPMDPADRLRFTADGMTEMKLDKSDIYWYYRQCKGEDFDEQYREAIESAGLEFESCGLNILPESISVDLSMQFKFIPVHVSFPLRVSYTDDELILTPVAARIGKIVLPIEVMEELVDKIDFLDDIVDFDVEDMKIALPYNSAFLKNIDSLEPGMDCLVMRGRMNTDFLENCDKGYNTYNLTYSRFLCKGYAMAEDIIEARIGSRGAAEKELFGYLSEKPGLLDDILYELLCFMDQTISSGYTPNLENHQFACRVADVFIRMEEVEKHRILQADYNENKKNWDNLLNALADDYNNGRLKVEGTELLYKNQPFAIEEYLGKDWNMYECFVDPGDCFFALVDYSEAKDPKNPILKKIIPDESNIPEGLNPDARYPLAFIIKGMDGNYWAGFRVYVTEIKENYLRLFKVSDSMMEEILNAEQFPVWSSE